MAITSNDCLLILYDMQEKGIDAKNYITKAINSEFPTVELIQFINKNRQFDLQKFYEKLRKSYNNKKSILYKNIVKEDLPSQELLTTLASLQLQTLLFAKTVKDKQMFLKHARFQELSKCMLNYAKKYDLIPCIEILKLVKADLKLFQYVKKKDEK